MVDYREILRLLSLRYNYTQIAEALHSSRNTVREVGKLADEKGISWPLKEELNDYSGPFWATSPEIESRRFGKREPLIPEIESHFDVSYNLDSRYT